MTEHDACCTTCENCLPIGEGDHLCDVYMELVLSDYIPTEDYNKCGGRAYVER